MINSSANQQIKKINRLKKSARHRKEEDVFLVEGIRMFREIPIDRCRGIYVSESFEKKNPVELRKIRYEVVADSVFQKISDTGTPQGILALVRRYHYRMEELFHQKNPLFVVLDGIQDPGNLGTILRTGEGAGVSGIIMSSDTADIYNPKAVRATMGSIFRVPFLYTQNIKNIQKEFGERKISMYAADLKGADYTKACLDEPCAFLIGNEGNGLSAQVRCMADRILSIPMEGQVESLNAAVAASLLMYEARRQRKGGK